MQSSNISLSKPQIIFLLHIGFLCILPLIGTTVFNMAKQLIEYSQFGFYYNDCLAYQTGYMNFTSFDFCKSEQIIPLVIGFTVSSGMFTFMAYRIYIYLTKEIKKN